MITEKLNQKTVEQSRVREGSRHAVSGVASVVERICENCRKIGKVVK